LFILHEIITMREVSVIFLFIIDLCWFE